MGETLRRKEGKGYNLIQFRIFVSHDERTCMIVKACAILHNLSIQRGDITQFEVAPMDAPLDSATENCGKNNKRQHQRHIILYEICGMDNISIIQTNNST